jgi:thioredoxin-related protein
MNSWYMKKLIIASLFVWLISAGTSFAQTDKKDTLVWYTDFVAVHEISKSTNKPIFAFFTGSDWCGWCHKLQKDVFAKKDFIDWANKSVVLLELDFPKRKQLPPELAQQNSGLQQQFQVRGYPTIWIFYSTKDETTSNFNLTALGSLGYPVGAEVGKEEVKFLTDANAILSSAKKQ